MSQNILHEYDVVIVGAGPGGSGTALHLRDSGLKIALLDKQSFLEIRCVVTE